MKRFTDYEKNNMLRNVINTMNNMILYSFDPHEFMFVEFTLENSIKGNIVFDGLSFLDFALNDHKLVK
jgi:hypothetical protein